jgi:hypothetical protein
MNSDREVAMKELLKVLLPFPVLAGVAMGLLYRAMGDWPHADAVALMGIVLLVDVWCHVAVGPYLRRKREKP